MFQTQRYAHSHVSDSELAAHLRQVFSYMTGGVALSGVVAYLTMNSPAMLSMATSGATSIVFLIIWFAFAFLMHKILFNVQPAVALGIFAAFSALTGFALTPVVLVYTQASIVSAFAVASLMFAGTSLYGYATKKNLSGWSTFLAMGCWGVIGLILVYLIGSLMGFQLQGMSLMISILVVPLIAAVTAYEVNMLKENYAQYAGNELMQSRMEIYGAASLYMNFVVLFIHLLNIMGQHK